MLRGIFYSKKEKGNHFLERKSSEHVSLPIREAKKLPTGLVLLMTFRAKKKKKNHFQSHQKEFRREWWDTSHSAYAATETESNGAKIDGF